jgi:alpha-1,2-mannosyltransferase
VTAGCAQHARPVSARPTRRLLYGGPVALIAAIGLYVAEFVHWPAYITQIDLMVYRFGGHRVLQGLDLYSTGIFGSHRVLLFTYTPFAALCFTPLNVLSLPWLRALSMAAAIALLTYSVQRILAELDTPRRPQWWTLTALLVGLCLWLEPVRYSIELGQVNLVILAVVVADLLGSSDRKWAGVGIGLVAGIKLTPVIFLIYLVLIGRRRAGLVGAAAFLATVVLGFAIIPGDSATYWLGGKFDNPQRVSPDPAVSSSVRGLFLRLHYPTAAATAVALALGLLCLAVGVLVWRQGHRVLGLSLVGQASAAASPFSWSHHWVWLVPLCVHLGYRGIVLGSRRALGAMWLLCGLTAGWLVVLQGKAPRSGLVAWRPGGLWNTLLPSGYLLVMLIAVIASAIWLRGTASGSRAAAVDVSSTGQPANAVNSRPAVVGDGRGPT